MASSISIKLIKSQLNAALSQVSLSALFDTIQSIRRVGGKFVMVVDTSGSMNESATNWTHKEALINQISRMDLIKYCIEIFFGGCGPDDEVSVITFNSYVTTLFENRKMTDEAKATSITQIRALRADNCTALWDGLRTGLQVAQKSGDDTPVILFTDGIPSDSPAEGEEGALNND